jgi:ABC-type dipeptide/oligopeptide/nickel transport system permease component
VFNGSTEMEVILAFNQRVAPLEDLRVRRAIAHALDRQAVIDGAMFGYGIPIGSHFPPRNPLYVDLTGRYPHDLARARALLAEAGYPHGFRMTLKLPPPSYARRGGEIIAAQLKQVGIELSIENLEWAQWLSQVYSRHEFDMTVIGHAEPLDYDIYARDNYYFGYRNPDFNALIAALDDTVADDRRAELLHAIQQKLADDAVNGFLFQYPRLDVWNRELTGVVFDNVLGTIDLAHASYQGASRGRQSPAAARGGVIWAGLLALALMAWLLMRVGREFGVLYLAQRLAILVLTLLVASVIVFVIVQVVPGDPVRYMMGMQADPEAIAAVRHQLGLDAPAASRYAAWAAGLLHGDLGVSYTYRVAVQTLVAERLQLSLPLAVLALLLASLFAFPLGLVAAARRGRLADSWISGLTQLGLAVPNFWLGMLLVLLFAVSLHVVSAGGFPGWDAGLVRALKSLALPALALAMPQAAILARVLRGALIEALQEDYIRTARAKGAGEWHVLWRHALPNALVPVLTILGMQFSFLLAGGVIIENVFFLPGLGRLIFQAIVQRDLMVVQSVVLLLVFAVVSVSLVVELAYAMLNPQLRAARAA